MNKVSQQNEADKKKVSVNEERREERTVTNARKPNVIQGNEQNLKVKGRNQQNRPQTG